MTKELVWIILILLILEVTSVSYYVSLNGNDSNASGSIDSPFLTIGAGLTALSCGDTLFIRGGDYYLIDDVFVKKDCQIPTTITGYQGELVRIIGYSKISNFTVSPTGYNTTSVPLYQGKDITFAHYPNGSHVFRYWYTDLTTGYSDLPASSGSPTYRLITKYGFYWDRSNSQLGIKVPPDVDSSQVLFALPVSLIVDIPFVEISGLTFLGSGSVALEARGNYSLIYNNTFETCFRALRTASHSKIEKNNFLFEGLEDAVDRTQFAGSKPTLWEVGYIIFQQYFFGLGYSCCPFIDSRDVENIEIKYNYFYKGLRGLEISGWKDSIIHHNKFDQTFYLAFFFNDGNLTQNISIHQNLIYNTSGIPTETRGPLEEIYIVRNVFHVPRINPLKSVWNLWSNIFLNTIKTINMFHNLIMLEDDKFTSNYDFFYNSNITMLNSVNNLYINHDVVYQNYTNYSSNVVINTVYISASCQNITWNSSNTCIKTSDNLVSFENLTQQNYGIIPNNITTDKGIVIFGWKDVNGPSVGNPDIGPFESNQHPDKNWPFVDPITDCIWTEWTTSDCDCNVSTKTRSVLIPNNTLGSPCSGTSVEMLACVSSSCSRLVVNCSWSEWSLWSPCICNETTRQRTIAQQNNSKGYPCEGLSTESSSCTFGTCESSSIVSANGVNNYTSTTPELSNTLLSVQNVSTFVSQATNISNSTVKISNTSNSIFFANTISSTTINFTISSVYYQQNLLLSSNSALYIQDSNISVTGNLTIDKNSMIVIDESSHISVSGCLDSYKITITPSLSPRLRSELSQSNSNALLSASCLSQDVEIVNENNEKCRKRVESKLSALLVFVNYNDCGTKNNAPNSQTIFSALYIVGVCLLTLIFVL
eukprot:TRINITY_DN7003_c0_g1_i1.p1 TRINITY_DN7003_c0_g1~~TRINITY_DN7003_c0_g1_i1.p1  ORF type:complete len:875 (+),score=90.62 TRINITY_DN7003_c0_g1_i1:40-2664(+)